MAKPQALVLTGFGINCDYETEEAFSLAGAGAERMHVNDLIANPALLERFQILVVPGGFSFGDNIASGKVLANKLKYRLGEAFLDFLRADRLVLGICNGFQVLVKLGVLPGGEEQNVRQTATVTFNDSGKFEDRWVRLQVEPGSRCVFTRGMDWLELPVRHGEGKFYVGDRALLEKLARDGQFALRYSMPDGSRPAAYPANPNGSEEDIAGVCDPSGRIFGLMPHPEAFVHRYQHPRWTRGNGDGEEGRGLRIFSNAVEYFD